MNFTSTSAQPLTIDQIGKFAPSALAVSPHESRSSRYAYLSTRDVIAGMQDAGFFPFKATQSKTRDLSRREFTKHMIRFRQIDQQLQRGDVFAEIVLVNAHDGTSAYKLMGGLWRLTCENGMCVSEAELASITVMHKGDIVEGVVRGSLDIASQSDRLIDTVGRWSGLQLTAGEQHALALASHTLRFGDSEGKTATPITPDQLLHMRRNDDTGSDLWRTFNRIQENVIKGGLHARTAPTIDENGRRIPSRRVSTREVKGIDQDVKLNRAMWQLAEEIGTPTR